MHREKIKNLLNQYDPHDLDEKQDHQLCNDFLRTHEDCFERSCLSGHFTGSAWLLNKMGTHALIMHHRKLNQWCQLGGHCDGDSDILAVALKEAQEESGIQDIAPVSESIFDLNIHGIPLYKDIPCHKHYDIRFLLQVQSDEDFIKNNESNELRWISKDRVSLPVGCDPSVIRLHQKWINRVA